MAADIKAFFASLKYDFITLGVILAAFAATAWAFVRYSTGMYYEFYYDTQYELSEGYTNFNFMEKVGALYIIVCALVINCCYFFGSRSGIKAAVWAVVSLVLLYVAATMVPEIVNFHPSSAATSCNIIWCTPLIVVACALAYALPFVATVWTIIYLIRERKHPALTITAGLLMILVSVLISVPLNIFTYFAMLIATT